MTFKIKNAHPLYQQTIPVFLKFTPRILTLAKCAEEHHLLSTRLIPDTFTIIEHLATAQEFSLRTVFPTIGKVCPDFSTERSTYADLQAADRELRQLLQSVRPEDFDCANERRITHMAGSAQLTQTGSEYVQLFGIPNFYFHISMAYATLRARGVHIGKAHFDGLHEYPAGFSFQSL